MNFRKSLLIAGLLTLAIALLSVGQVSAVDCAGLAAPGLFGSNVHVTAATVVSATADVPEHCKVEGWQYPEEGFIIKLPTTWNKKLYQVGNGGAAGSINESSMALGLKKGYATAGGSGGHLQPTTGYYFGYGWWEDAAINEKVEDYCKGSLHKTNVLARNMIKEFYGVNQPDYAYYNGYSTGGRQAMAATQWFPDDFDGVMGGDAPIPFTKRTMGDTWESTKLLGTGYIPVTKLPILAAAVMKKCDSIDGLVDGLIDDPRKCTFNALAGLPACPNDVDGPECFTTAQRQAAYDIYDGVRNTSGDLIFKGVSYGTEAMMGNGASGWTMFVPTTPGGSTFALGLGSSFVQWIGLPPTKGGPTWDWKTFSVNPDWNIVTDHWGEQCDTYNPDLSPFKAAGGKFIYYHGWADALCWARPAPDYYDQVIPTMGGLKETQEFFKIYMIPGMTHFPPSRGVFNNSTIQEPLFVALEKWVEEGVEPGAFVGTQQAAEGYYGALSRPICPYPEVARYLGTGSADDAANFACVKPIPAKVRIEPETINLKSNGVFTAFFKLPSEHHKKYGHDKKSFGLTVVCEGAPALRGTAIRHGDGFIAKFKTQDLINISPADKITFTAYAIFEDHGKKYAFEGSDLVRVIEKDCKPPKKGK